MATTLPNNFDIGYLAGFIDGEGCVGFHRYKYHLNKSGYKFVPILEVANTNMEVLNQLQIKWGGSIYLKKGWHGEYKKCFALRFGAKLQRQILPLIEPYLIIKRVHACLLLEYFNLVDNFSVHTFGIYPEYDRIYQRLKVMNMHKSLKSYNVA